MVHLILTGATGLAGSAILKQALDSPTISKISILSRRPVSLGSDSPKTQVILHQDFASYPEPLLAQLSGASACIWAQGRSSVGMKEGEYRKLTVDYPLAAAEAFAKLGSVNGEGNADGSADGSVGGKGMNFVYISGEGAEMNKTSGQMFARVKGEAEKRLLALGEGPGALRVFNLRPGGIIPEGGKNLAERKPTIMDRSLGFLGFVMKGIVPNLVISTEGLAKVCVELAAGDGEPVREGKGVESGGRLLRNVAIKEMAGRL